MKMAASQGAVGPAVALQSHHYPNVAHWNPGVMHQQQHPLHTARSLERALEDAVCSGMLNISGRKLRDYPGLNYDLTDTTQADLSKNRFCEIPPEVCIFAPLESLNLYHNCIKVVPEAIINLQMLTYLNISRNQLSVLPKFLFSLPLKVLVVSNNKLLSIPEEIGKAKDLMELDISCNEIQVLPAQMGKLLALRELNIRRNCLQVLPDELSDLPLIRLDFSCNKITEIPISYRKLKQLQHIILDNNPMQSPPAQVCLYSVTVYLFTCIELKLKSFHCCLFLFCRRHLVADNGKSLQYQVSTEPSFTMRRKMEHLREEMEQIRLLQQNLESRLKVLLPDDVGAALMDGVVLCHLANHIRPRSVASIHVPSPAVPKLSMAKCRRNVENFLDACKKLGVPQDKLCLPHHILEERGLVKVGVTVQALLDLPSSKPNQLSTM
uniref:Leucine-rich repeats and calponin homology (CH) domain containing 2 n=1 Tax=Cyprinus carpio carpio TaxID=630221 RepID=A0A9J8BQB4_CYPCA